MKFHVDVLHYFKVMLRTKKGRTDGHTEGLTDGGTDGWTSRLLYAHPLGGGIQTVLNINFTTFDASTCHNLTDDI